MRLWTLHARYLDTKGLVALWREALLAKAVIAGQTRGYKHHPQLTRFLATPYPEKYITSYLHGVYNESIARGYHFDVTKIGPYNELPPMTTTIEEIEYEWEHLSNKLIQRAPKWYSQLQKGNVPDTHPLFIVVDDSLAKPRIHDRPSSAADK